MTVPEDRVARLTRRLLRERRARKEAEAIVQDRGRELAELRAAASSFEVTDPVTGLGNDLGFRRRCETLAAHSATTAFALILVDLTLLETIVRSFGHVAADDTLRIAAGRLERECCDANMLARTGDHQFAILATADSDPAELAAAVAATLARPVLCANRRLSIGAIVGVALSPEHGCTPKELQRNAALAVDHAKAAAAAFSVYDPALGREHDLQQALAAELAHALFDGQIEPWFQPIVEPATSRVRTAEILARWRHPTRGLLSPAVFLPLLEERHLMDDLFAQLLRTAAPLARRWVAEGALRSVSINVSPSQFRSGHFAEDVRDLLLDLDLPPTMLAIEVTEEIIAHDYGAVRAQLADLSRLGVHLALDDFGVGYSNVGILRHLSFDTLKIDRSLIVGVSTEPRVGAVLGAIVGLARALDMVPVAEGIEHEQQAAALLQLGFAAQQGFYFGRPTPADEFERSLGLATAAP